MRGEQRESGRELRNETKGNHFDAALHLVGTNTKNSPKFPVFPELNDRNQKFNLVPRSDQVVYFVKHILAPQKYFGLAKITC